MMSKKMLLCILMLALVGSMLMGCGGSSNTEKGSDSNSGGKNKTVATTVDVDLTILSSTMVYSEVSNMLSTPDEYVGKYVRMAGQFVAYSNQDQSMYYPAVIIADATACCSQGLEFVLKGEPKYPEGYPKEQDEISVVGRFETYDEDGVVYCHLVDAEIEE